MGGIVPLPFRFYFERINPPGLNYAHDLSRVLNAFGSAFRMIL